ncbi:MAG: tetratricopeptide repeat protein [Pseudomonadota bacterium]|nr:tetratricopeptide repeat protein [Pseudomonadota bacterium]
MAEPSFSQGVKSYQDNQLELAREQFQQALKGSPNNILTLYNLGLVEYKLGKKGLGLAYWRKALDLDPGNRKTLSAIRFATDELLANKPIPPKSFYETLREVILIHTSFGLALLFSFAFSIGAVWILLTYLGFRRRALTQGLVPAKHPLYGYLCWVIAAFFTGISTLKYIDLNIMRATIVSGPAIVRSSPNEDATNLFVLFEGSEVIVRQSKDAWTQVSLPGKNTGWVLREQLFINAGKM